MKPRAFLVDGGKAVVFKRDLHKDRFSVDRLAGWIAFYERAEKLARSQRARTLYAEDVAALRGVARQIEAAR